MRFFAKRLGAEEKDRSCKALNAFFASSGEEKLFGMRMCLPRIILSIR